MRLSDSRLVKEGNFLKFKGDPYQAIDGDLILLFKALHNSIKFDLWIDIQDWIAIQDYVHFLYKIPLDEKKKWINKTLLLHRHSLFLYKLRHSGYLKVLFPEIYKTVGCLIDPLSPEKGDIFDCICSDMDLLPKDSTLEEIWATLLKRVDCQEDVLKRFKFNKKFIEDIMLKISEFS